MKQIGIVEKYKNIVVVEKGNSFMKIKHYFMQLALFCLLVLFSNNMFSNNVVVSNLAINGQNTSNHSSLINFDISWDNSWRNSVGTTNWDACWVFVKYRKKAENTWHHATLSTTNSDHTAPTNSIIRTSSDGKGIFIYRSGDMLQGSVSYTGAKLQWNYGTDGLVDADSVEVCVFAIEMVYVPTGSFYVGDGTTTDIEGQFESGTSGAAKQITSEGSLTLGGGGTNSLGNNNASGMNTADDFNDGTSKTLPAAFPKGYNAYYCMKYSVTQEQYVAFLNKLTYTQQDTRTAIAPNSAAGTGALKSDNAYRNGIDIMTPGVSSNTPAVYACNLDGDANYNETVDGQNIACNYLSWADLAAYLDWAALRPMSELEYEKTCRGDHAVVANEYAWGTTNITQATGISNSGANNETASNSGANCAYGNNSNVQGPVRVGCFGQGVNTREGVGASYYGIMEMTGNLWERCVTVGNNTGRAYTGIHGDGALDITGDANVSNWPVSSGTGSCFRGGDWNDVLVWLRVSDRIRGAKSYSTRGYSYGGHGVRMVP